MTSEEYEKSSRLWYLIPIFLGIIGGLIAYLILKKDNSKLAKRCLIVGILITIIPFIIGVFLVLYGTMFAGLDTGNLFQRDVTILEEYMCETNPVQFSNIHSNDPPLFVDKWGSFGKEGGQFGYPQDIAIDSQSNVYVTDSGARDEIYRVQKFSSNGGFISEWGSMGTEHGQFIRPSHIVIDSEDNVYVADMQNYRLQKFSSDGEFITTWGKNEIKKYRFGNISGLAVDSFNYIYVLDKDARGTDRVAKFSNDGEFISVWILVDFNNAQITKPVDITADVHGYVYILESNAKIQKFDCHGNFINTLNIVIPKYFHNPEHISIDPNGFIYISASSGESEILKFSNDGDFITKWGSRGSDDGQFVGAGSVAVDPIGNVYVIDTTHGRIQKFI